MRNRLAMSGSAQHARFGPETSVPCWAWGPATLAWRLAELIPWTDSSKPIQRLAADAACRPPAACSPAAATCVSGLERWRLADHRAARLRSAAAKTMDSRCSKEPERDLGDARPSAVAAAAWDERARHTVEQRDSARRSTSDSSTEPRSLALADTKALADTLAAAAVVPSGTADTELGARRLASDTAAAWPEREPVAQAHRSREPWRSPHRRRLCARDRRAFRSQPSRRLLVRQRIAVEATNGLCQASPVTAAPGVQGPRWSTRRWRSRFASREANLREIAGGGPQDRGRASESLPTTVSATPPAIETTTGVLYFGEPHATT
jgi:hypothetical protein